MPRNSADLQLSPEVKEPQVRWAGGGLWEALLSTAGRVSRDASATVMIVR